MSVEPRRAEAFGRAVPDVRRGPRRDVVPLTRSEGGREERNWEEGAIGESSRARLAARKAAARRSSDINTGRDKTRGVV